MFQVVVGDLPADFPPVVSVAAEAVELPPELDAGTPLAGREAELDALREQWRRAHGGAGRLVLVAGARGMGKTRLAAELAGEVHRDRGAVLYASGAGAPETALAALARARVARRPTLLVLDDVDRAGEEVWAALGELVDALAALPVLVLATAEDAGPAGRAARGRDAEPGAAGRRRRARGGSALRGRTRRTRRYRSSSSPRRAAACRSACTAPRASGRARWPSAA